MKIMKNIHNIVSDMQERFPDYVIILHRRGDSDTIWTVEIVNQHEVLKIDILIVPQESRVIPISIMNDFRSEIFIEIIRWLLAAF